MVLCSQKLQQKKIQSGKKQQQQQQPKQPEKQQGHYVQALVALHGEVTSKLSILGFLMKINGQSCRH
jgi:hypothetical protein